tara:strand:- start:876 stop:1397 length:522 start_codon:yes stop_codon:yes gene_type:complete
MPNHCSNRVSFYSDNESDIQKLHSIFLKGIENDDNVDTGSVFGSFIPEPDWANIPLSEEDQYEYSFSSARGEVGEKPVMVINEESPFMNGLRFKSTNAQDDRWYNWRVQNWGTKWDCYTLEMDDTDLPHGFEVTFETAWSPPEEVCHAIREQYPNVSISWFYDEPGCEIAGYL